MPQKIAVAVIHGIGEANPEFKEEDSPKFTSGFAKKLKSEFAEVLDEEVDTVDAKLVIEPIYWAEVVQAIQDELCDRLQIQGKLKKFFKLGEFIFHSLSDSVAYQVTSSPSSSDRHIYDGIHQCFSDTLKKLATSAGAKAPLCIVAHSLGSTIASNYIWDLQNNLAQISIGNTPLEKGETLALFYTFGSQIAFWSLRHKDFGTPIAVPSPKLSQHYPNLKGEWVNFYDEDDLLGYPIQNINEKYKRVVKDKKVNAGGMLQNWNPTSHNEYWKDGQVVKPIAKTLADTWRSLNP